MGDEPDGLGGAKPLSSLFPKCLSFFFTHEWMSGGIIGLACSSTSAHLSPETGSFPGRSFMPRVPPEPAAESQQGQPAKGAPSGDSRAVWVCVCNGRLTDRPSICLVRGAQKKGIQHSDPKCMLFNIQRAPPDGLHSFREFNLTF